MSSFRGRFELLAPGKGAVRSGDCELGFDDRTVTLVTDGPSLAFDLGDIEAFEPADFQIRLSLFDGHDLVLTRFAKASQDLERQLRDAYRDRLVRCLLVNDLTEVARFGGRVDLHSPTRRCSGPAEIRLYESNLAVLPDSGTGFQWRLAEIERVEFDEPGYAVRFIRGAEVLSVGRLAKRTAELAESTRSRIVALRERTTRVLQRVFPFLPPGQFSRLADVMREGASVSISDIAPLHPLVEGALLETVVDDGLAPYVKALASRATSPWFAGFKIIRAESVDDTTEPSGQAGGAGEEAPGAPDSDGEDRREPVESVLDAGDGLEALFWFFFPLGGAAERPTHLAWEATSRGGRATYIFKCAGGCAVRKTVAAINEGLVALNFRRGPIYLPTRRLECEHPYRHYAIALRRLPELAPVRDAFAGRAIHTTPGAWAGQVDRILQA